MYKLGSILYDTIDPTTRKDVDRFEWYLNQETPNLFTLTVPLGIYDVFHPIVQKARELVILLNEEEKKNASK